MGIAVGMATNIPPHNLGELVDAIQYLIENPDCDVKDLTQFVKGPDFPTGGSIFNQADIQQAYLTGRGSIVCRAETEIVETKSGMFQIIVTEMTYASNKSTMIEKMADLVKTGKIEGIRDLRDESDKDGVRIVIELKKEAFPEKNSQQALYPHRSAKIFSREYAGAGRRNRAESAESQSDA